MSEEQKIPVVIDCDPGHDDMMALVLAYGSGKLDIRAVTTVAGNNTISNTTNNALNVLHYIGADEIPVAMGYQDPIVRSHKESMDRLKARRPKPANNPEKSGENTENITGASVHGITGLDGFTFPPDNPKKPESIRAVEMIARVVRESEDPITLIPTGPLTNIGLFIKAFPDLTHKIKRISLMGGTCEFILSRPFMEFNTFVDPEATKIVFESGIPITMFGYDVTYSVLYDRLTIDQIEAVGNQSSGMVKSLLDTFMVRHNSSLNHLKLKDSCPVHDACAVAGVIDPALITESKMIHVDIETSGTYFDGATVCDYVSALGLEPNVEVVYRMDNEKFLSMLVEAVRNCK